MTRHPRSQDKSQNTVCFSVHNSLAAPLHHSRLRSQSRQIHMPFEENRTHDLAQGHSAFRPHFRAQCQNALECLSKDRCMTSLKFRSRSRCIYCCNLEPTYFSLGDIDSAGRATPCRVLCVRPDSSVTEVLTLYNLFLKLPACAFRLADLVGARKKCSP